MAEDEERARKYWENISRIERKERLMGAIESVWLAYQLLEARAEPGSDEREEFGALRKYYMDVKKRVHLLSEDEKDRILEEYPKIADRLDWEYGL
ncbi:hypothetical protein ABZ644_16740 [Nocardiopsis alba]|uniref:hypothetical protein n=1 Tax=Nocardiopsis alba TaxID=53437 RepID=UPI0033EAA3F4